MSTAVLAIDQGTTGTTCLVVDEELEVIGRGYAELPQYFPRPGWVEHDPEEIWQSVLVAAEAAISRGGVEPTAIGITNQRETTLLWDRASGRPVQNAIVWQDRRTADRCAELPAGLIRERTGLVPDPYFSASKLEWLLREHGSANDLAFGTVDTWLVWKLTEGRVHVTDETNASRTLLCSLDTLDWDDELLALFDVRRELLPEIRASGTHFGEGELLGRALPIQSIAGDQQAALFAAGGAKATYGTGSFVLVETEAASGEGVLRTAAARLEGEEPRRALEGAVFVTGAAVQWLRDGLGLISEAGESEALAASLDPRLASEISSLTVGELKSTLLSGKGTAWASRYADGLSSEAIAAVVKLMTNEELSFVARKLFNPLPGEGVQIGSPQHFGSRIQPNSPGDDDEEILFSVLEGLSYGCGDVVLGLNPAADDLETIVRLEELLRSVVERLNLPTRYCVLSDIVKQSSARTRVRVDVGFQSLAGTSKALGGMVGLDVDGLLELARGFGGLYFETGQGSEVTNGADEGSDMVTLEARSYGVARHTGRRTGAWMIVNDVAGFIGPEVFRTGAQLLRACL
ncbi:MAG: glycerol kinase, partial [Gaiellaceae bacterium]|nr:glycerol kinase [Gaiellaceae bacterium]